MPLAKNGIRLLRCFKQIIKAPTTSKAPIIESTVLSVMTRVWLLPLPEASLDGLSVCPMISVAEATGEVGGLEVIAVLVSLPAQEAGRGVSMPDFVELEEPDRSVPEVGTVEVGNDTATGVILEGPVTVPGFGEVEREIVAGGVMVSGVVDGGGQNVQYEVGRLPSPVCPGGP